MIKQLSDLEAIVGIEFKHGHDEICIDKHEVGDVEIRYFIKESFNKTFVASINKVSAKNLYWYTWVLDKKVSGCIPLSELPKPITNENQLPADSL